MNWRGIWFKLHHRQEIVPLLPKVHGVDKRVDPNVQPEKQIIKPVLTPQSNISTQSKDQFHVEPRLGQGRPGMKKNVIRFPMLNHK